MIVPVWNEESLAVQRWLPCSSHQIPGQNLECAGHCQLCVMGFVHKWNVCVCVCVVTPQGGTAMPDVVTMNHLQDLKPNRWIHKTTAQSLVTGLLFIITTVNRGFPLISTRGHLIISWLVVILLFRILTGWGKVTVNWKIFVLKIFRKKKFRVKKNS